VLDISGANLLFVFASSFLVCEYFMNLFDLNDAILIVETIDIGMLHFDKLLDVI
jgi:hypothetical protein